ncbi:hypothetical protein SCHPADRAFT_937117 [Schizopora paradoxa]|uniref:Arrestin-like N-terminal domain-containing protein n=1 Tax=Schizopora paradoxa TaxID=27342 RepID=A0A0H2S0Q2_9AGAM|nr:hypothetical protein SCHPADRAFT_937117 [Schizopora paradoxa]
MSDDKKNLAYIGNNEHEQHDFDLPEYESIGAAPAAYSEPETEREFSLQDNKGRTFLTLIVRSTAPASSLPSFLEGQPIGGKVILDLEKPESIKSISVTVQGAARFSVLDDRPFLKVTETLYKCENDTGSRGLLESITGGEKMDAGRREFDFRIILPSETTVDKALWHDAKVNESVRLPPALSSKAWNWAFYYAISVEVKRSGLLSIDDNLKQNIGYTPLVKPPKPSALRLQAYKDKTPIPGPDADPEGWKSFPPVEIKGELFKAKNVTALYSLAIATPLIYAAGTIVHFFLTVESDDEQALALLADPSSPDVSIRRKIKSIPGVGDTGGNLILPGSEEERPIAKVVWCNPPGDQLTGRSATQRVLYGELKLPPASTLRPSFEFGDFHMKYCIDMFAPILTGFATDIKHRLFRTDVVICAGHYGEPSPRSYLPGASAPSSSTENQV